MSITSYSEVLQRHITRFQPKVDVEDLRAFMVANYSTMTAKDIGEKFGIAASTVKRYAKEFRLKKQSYAAAPKVKNELQPNQREINTGILTVIGPLTIHVSKVRIQ